jgi:hypothetical protein
MSDQEGDRAPITIDGLNVAQWITQIEAEIEARKAELLALHGDAWKNDARLRALEARKLFMLRQAFGGGSDPRGTS